MPREEHVAKIISFVWDHIDVEEMAEESMTFIYVLFSLLDSAIEEEVRAVPSLYEQAKRVSLN
jgi:hypothetical protein